MFAISVPLRARSQNIAARSHSNNTTANTTIDTFPRIVPGIAEAQFRQIDDKRVGSLNHPRCYEALFPRHAGQALKHLTIRSSKSITIPKPGEDETKSFQTPSNPLLSSFYGSSRAMHAAFQVPTLVDQWW